MTCPRLRTIAVFLFPVAALWCAHRASADLDTQLLNGNKVAGSFLPAGEVETFRVFVPRGAKLAATVAGKKAKGAPTPKVTLALDVPEGDPAGTVKVTKTGGKLSGFTTSSSGEHAFRLTSAQAGNYLFSVKWKSPSGTKKSSFTFEPADELEFPVSADAGTLLTVSAAASKKSAAIPRLTYVESADGEWFSDPFDEPDDFEFPKHTVKKIALGGAGGDYIVHVEETGGEGGAAALAITLKPQRVKPRTLQLTTKQTGADPVSQFAKGAVIGDEGGLIEIGTDAGSLIDKSSLSVPPGALGNPVVIVMSTAAPFSPGPGVEAAGAGVNFTPDGLQFKSTDEGVFATIPFDSSKFAGDFSAFEIYVQEANGTIARVEPTSDYEIDAEAGTVTFPVSHFSRYQVFRPAAPKSNDLNADGYADLVVPASAADGGRGRVYVFFGGPSFNPSSSTGASVTLAGSSTGDAFGRSVAAGDVNGDGIADLVVGAPGAAGGGRVDVFLGGSGFSAQTQRISYTGGTGASAFGAAVLVADITGDGARDLVVSDPDYSGVEVPSVGAVHVVPGGGSLAGGALPSAASFLFDGGFPDTHLGISLTAGRLVGEDAVPDLVIGAAEGAPGSGTGSVYVVTGGALLESGYAGDYGPSWGGDLVGDAFGAAVAVMDVDLDGSPDLVVGAPGADVILPNESIVAASGQVYVFLGPEPVGGSASIADIETNISPSAGEERGRSLAVGNFYGNSVRGLAVGLPGHSEPGAAGLGRSSLQRAGENFELAFELAAGSGPGARFGERFTLPVDLDGNGRDELGVASPGARGGDGIVSVFFGPGLYGPKIVLIYGQAGERLGE